MSAMPAEGLRSKAPDPRDVSVASRRGFWGMSTGKTLAVPQPRIDIAREFCARFASRVWRTDGRAQTSRGPSGVLGEDMEVELW